MMVAKSPRDRFQSMQEVIDALSASGQQTTITIAYRTHDSLDASDRLREQLAKRWSNNRIYMQSDMPSAGTHIERDLARRSTTGGVVLVMIGDYWTHSPQRHWWSSGNRLKSTRDPIRVLLEQALGRESLVIPVLVGQAVMPPRRQLPASLREFADLAPAELRAGREWNEDLARLIARIEHHLTQAH
jgi:hypothetical protein